MSSSHSPIPDITIAGVPFTKFYYIAFNQISSLQKGFELAGGKGHILGPGGEDAMKIIEDVTSVIGENFDCLFSCEVKPVEQPPPDWFYDEERQQFY